MLLTVYVKHYGQQPQLRSGGSAMREALLFAILIAWGPQTNKPGKRWRYSAAQHSLGSPGMPECNGEHPQCILVDNPLPVNRDDRLQTTSQPAHDFPCCL
eukprot:1138506-Pelagomonas_calceolata.AAC.22